VPCSSKEHNLLVPTHLTPDDYHVHPPSSYNILAKNRPSLYHILSELGSIHGSSALNRWRNIMKVLKSDFVLTILGDSDFS
jgi:hypothetical protein